MNYVDSSRIAVGGRPYWYIGILVLCIAYSVQYTGITYSPVILWLLTCANDVITFIILIISSFRRNHVISNPPSGGTRDELCGLI